MDNYLQIIITISIGIVAFLLSSYGRSAKMSRQALEQQNNNLKQSPEEFDDFIDELNFGENIKEFSDTTIPIVEIDNEITQKVKKNDLKHTHEINKRKTVNRSLKSFDLKRAVLYSEILNKKYS